MLEFLRSLVLSQEAQGNQETQEDQHDQGIQEYQDNQLFKTGKQSLVQEVLGAIQNRSLNEPLLRCRSMLSNQKNVTLLTAGGRIACLQCNAKSKRTGIQCRAPAAKGKTKCRFHGGASTGPKTEQGRQRCAEAKTIHGRETRKARTERAMGMRQLRELEGLGYALGIMFGPKTSGKKPLKTSDLMSRTYK